MSLKFGRAASNPPRDPFWRWRIAVRAWHHRDAERIFEPFFSAGDEGGSGLGLFLARELAQTSGATLLYEPRAAGGSIFRLVFADPSRWAVR